MNCICGRCSKMMIMASSHKQENVYYMSFHCLRCTNDVIVSRDE